MALFSSGTPLVGIQITPPQIGLEKAIYIAEKIAQRISYSNKQKS